MKYTSLAVLALLLGAAFAIAGDRRPFPVATATGNTINRVVGFPARVAVAAFRGPHRQAVQRQRFSYRQTAPLVLERQRFSYRQTAPLVLHRECRQTAPLVVERVVHREYRQTAPLVVERQSFSYRQSAPLVAQRESYSYRETAPVVAQRESYSYRQEETAAPPSCAQQETATPPSCVQRIAVPQETDPCQVRQIRVEKYRYRR